MKNYSINIAKAHTMSDWRGLPAHMHLARVHLRDTLSEADAMAELERLALAYPWPEYHLTLSRVETVAQSTTCASTAPTAFLDAHRWAYRSIHQEA